MKRVGNLYEEICSIDNLMIAHEHAKRGKGHYREVKMVDGNKAKYLYALQDMLINKTYKTSEYEIFERAEHGKVRQIYKLPYYPDRICQWAMIQVIEKYLLRTMTKDTYSAIPGRGTGLVFKRVKQALADEQGTMWCLKMDVKKYYPSIDHKLLKKKYRRMFKDNDLLWLLDEIIDSTPGGRGIPIGNYLSQYSGNIFLSDFDHAVKEQFGVKYYFRYMDDLVFFFETQEEAWRMMRLVVDFMRKMLKLEIKENWSIFRIEDRGVDFVGYVFKHGEVRLRKTIVRTLKKVNLQIRNRVNNGKMMTRKQYFAINSLRGWVNNCTSDGLRVKYIDTIQDYIDEYYEAKIKGGKCLANSS